MIGIVVVSHSHALAQAAVALAGEMLHDQPVRIETAAGLDETTFGTDAVAVAEAITAADTGAGVLILMDLGSAVLSAELALELLESPHRVRLCAAPIVEGLIAAAVAAAGGADLEEAAAEANNALLGKRTQLGETDPASPAASDSDESDTAAQVMIGDGHGGAGGIAASVEATFRVSNVHGLHARPASALVAAIRGRDARVRLRNLTTGAGPASGTSLTRIAALGVLAGHEVEITATGPEARYVVTRVLALAADRFGEAPASEPATLRQGISSEPVDSGDEHAGMTGRTLRSGPFPASPGIAIGPVWRLEAVEFDLPTRPAADPVAERERLNVAITQVRNDIEAAIGRANAAGMPTAPNLESGIFRAHLLLLEDDELIGAVRERAAGGASAERAWAAVLDDAAGELARLPDEYQRARAADIRAVRDQVLAVLLGRGGEIVSRPGILVAADLTPGQVAALDREVVTGIVLAQGSPTAHGVIIARSKGIPAVVGAGPPVLAVADGTTVAFDGGTGRLVVDPDAAAIAEFGTRATELLEYRRAAAAVARHPARTRDGATVHVAANVGSVADATDAVRGGADLAGLVRTEFLFLNRDHAPSVDEQEQVYREIARAFGNRRIVLRTLDVGGDKPLPYIRQPREANPFLGLRGIRLALAHPGLLRDQLRAIVRVAADHPVSVMFPMVTAVDEVRAARELLEEIAPQDRSIEIGIMVEVPATAAKAAAFAKSVDFFSIGTNDLTQYALAAERGNDALAALADPLDPGVLHLIDQVCRGAGEARVAVCGEVAADPAAIPLLLGLGVTELSVAPPSIALTKAAVRDLSLADCAQLARRALSLESAAEVRAAVATYGAP